MILKPFQQANKWLREQKLEEAIAAYRSAIRDNPDFYWAYHNLGEALEKLGDWEEAVEAYSRVIELNPQATWSFLGLSRALQQVGRTQEAQQATEKAMQIQPKLAGFVGNGHVIEENVSEVNPFTEDPWLRSHQLAAQLYRDGKIDESILAYRQAIEVNPGYPNSYYELAKVLQEQGQLEEAIATYQEATELAPQESLFHQALAQILAANGRFDEAVASYKSALQLQSKSSDIYKELGTVLAKRSQLDLEQAVNFYCQAIYLNPQDQESLNHLKRIASNNPDPYLKLAKYLIQENYLESAIPICKIPISLHIANPNISKLHSLAVKRKLKVDQDLALKNHYQKLQQFPENPEVFIELGKALVEQNRIDQAIVFYQMGLKIKPDYADIYFEMGNALKAQDNFEKTVECYRKAINIRPDYCWYYNGLGDTLTSMGDFDEAVNAYRKALEINPDFAGFSHNLEKALKQQERFNGFREFCHSFSKPRINKIQGSESLKILMVTSYPPYPPNSGAPMRMFEEIKYLGSRHHLVVVSFIFSEEDYVIETELADYCDRAIMIMLGAPYAPRKPNEPKQVHRWHSWNMRKTLEEVRKVNFDVVLFDFIYMAPYVDLFQEAYTVLEEHNIESNLLHQCALASQGNAQLETVATDVDAVKAFLDADKEAGLLQEYETRTWCQFNLVTLVSEADRKQVEQRRSGVETLVVENGTDTVGITPVDNTQARKILFMGNLAYYPNIDGVLFFVDEILPRIWEQDPTMSVCIAGRDPGVQMQKLAQDSRIEIVASPKDMSEVAKECMMTVVPLRLGSGTRLKVLHSMAMGLPVVSTTLGCEGLAVVDGIHILMRDEPQKFADAVIEISRDQNWRNKLRLSGLELVQSQYTWKTIFSRLEEKLLNGVLC